MISPEALEDDAGRLRYTTRQLSSILLPDEPVPHITFGELPEGTAAEYHSGVIHISPEWVAGTMWPAECAAVDRWEATAAMVTHELGHVALDRRGYAGEDEHGFMYVRVARRFAARLAIPGPRSRAAARQWPYSQLAEGLWSGQLLAVVGWET